MDKRKWGIEKFRCERMGRIIVSIKGLLSEKGGYAIILIWENHRAKGGFTLLIFGGF